MAGTAMAVREHPFEERVGVIGCPDSLERHSSHAPALWTADNLRRLVELGFTEVQLNLA
jgi:hypothetical protein